jgi:hypothetical protein
MVKSTEKSKTLDIAIENKVVSHPDRAARIAELTYYKAEQRGFEPGHELEDWLEAEQEVILNESNAPHSATADFEPRLVA